MCVRSLVAPVQSDGDVSLDVSALVLRQVARQELPPQVDQLHHHVPDLVEQIHLVFLMETERLRGMLQAEPRKLSFAGCDEGTARLY